MSDFGMYYILDSDPFPFSYNLERNFHKPRNFLNFPLHCTSQKIKKETFLCERIIELLM